MTTSKQIQSLLDSFHVRLAAIRAASSHPLASSAVRRLEEREGRGPVEEVPYPPEQIGE